MRTVISGVVAALIILGLAGDVVMGQPRFSNPEPHPSLNPTVQVVLRPRPASLPASALRSIGIEK